MTVGGCWRHGWASDVVVVMSLHRFWFSGCIRVGCCSYDDGGDGISAWRCVAVQFNRFEDVGICWYMFVAWAVAEHNIWLELYL